MTPPRESPPGVEGETAVRINPLSPLIRKGAWYERSDGARYIFEDKGATYESIVPAPGPYSVAEGETNSWTGTRILFEAESGGYFFVDGTFVEDRFVLAYSQPVDDLNAIGIRTWLDSNGQECADAESVKSARYAMTGEYVSQLTGAAVECTDNTVSISWSEGDATLYEALGSDASAERLRIEDDGLRLVGLKNGENQFVLK